MPPADPPLTTTGNSTHTPSPTSTKSPSSTALLCFATNLAKIIQEAQTFEQKYPSRKESLASAFHVFFQRIRECRPAYIPPAPTPTPGHTDLGTELRELREMLTALQKSVANLQNTPNPPPPASDKQQRAAFISETAKPTSTDTAVEAAFLNTCKTAHKPPLHPSVVVHTATNDLTKRPPPHVICNTINESLKRSSHPNICFSSAKWTAKGNIILTGGHTNTLQQIVAAKNSISKTIASNFPTIHTTANAPNITANVKWSKILVNNVPTGASNNQGPRNPDECHKALSINNPEYAALNITQRPSWVKPPNSYKSNSTSSLVFAFEDPHGHVAQNLISSKHLHIFGTCATLRLWKDGHSPRATQRRGESRRREEDQRDTRGEEPLEAQRKPLTVKQTMKREREDEDTREGSQTSPLLQDTQRAAYPRDTISSTGATLAFIQA